MKKKKEIEITVIEHDQHYVIAVDNFSWKRMFLYGFVGMLNETPAFTHDINFACPFKHKEEFKNLADIVAEFLGKMFYAMEKQNNFGERELKTEQEKSWGAPLIYVRDIAFCATYDHVAFMNEPESAEEEEKLKSANRGMPAYLAPVKPTKKSRRKGAEKEKNGKWQLSS